MKSFDAFLILLDGSTVLSSVLFHGKDNCQSYVGYFWELRIFLTDRVVDFIKYISLMVRSSDPHSLISFCLETIANPIWGYFTVSCQGQGIFGYRILESLFYSHRLKNQFFLEFRYPGSNRLYRLSVSQAQNQGLGRWAPAITRFVAYSSNFPSFPFLRYRLSDGTWWSLSLLLPKFDSMVKPRSEIDFIVKPFVVSSLFFCNL